MSTPPDRIYIPGDQPILAGFRALRAWIEQHAAARGKTLDPAWYDDGPDKAPWLYKDLPTKKETDDE
jgi:hypothetical protein